MGGHRRTIAISVGRELRVRAIIGLDGDGMEALIDAGFRPPSPVVAEGQIDTGCTTTAVSPAVLQRCRAVKMGSTSSSTAAGKVTVDLYSISFGLYADDAETNPVSLIQNLEVSELAAPIPGTDVLIGMDVLEHCRLLVDGPAGTFTLEF
jgi:hypothetical protein